MDDKNYYDEILDEYADVESDLTYDKDDIRFLVLNRDLRVLADEVVELRDFVEDIFYFLVNVFTYVSEVNKENLNNILSGVVRKKFLCWNDVNRVDDIQDESSQKTKKTGKTKTKKS